MPRFGQYIAGEVLPHAFQVGKLTKDESIVTIDEEIKRHSSRQENGPDNTKHDQRIAHTSVEVSAGPSSWTRELLPARCHTFKRLV